MDNSETLNKDLEEMNNELEIDNGDSMDAISTITTDYDESTEQAIEESTEESTEEASEDAVADVYDNTTTAIVEELQTQNELIQQGNDTLSFVLIVLLFILFKTYVVHIWEHIRSIGK